MSKTQQILGVITARGGSKGLPGKNIKMLGGKSLIAWSVEVAKQSELITRTIVSTDDEAIAVAARQAGGEVPFMRPAELAADITPHVPVMQHAVKFMEEREGVVYDYVVIFQPTSPFRTKDDIDLTLQELINSKADSAVTLMEVESIAHPTKMKKLVGGLVKPYCMPEIEGTRRQDLPVCYKRSGALYAMRRDLLMKDGLIYGSKIVGHVVPKERSIDIDTPLDWLITEEMLTKLRAAGQFI